MCRFVLYSGPPITLDLLTTRPEHSIIHQSFKARLRTEPLNGDGFGLAWYVPAISPEPAAFRSTQPAWNNLNLRNLARVTTSGLIFAHVRAATSGLGVSEANCHPFTAGRLAFMHNGAVAGFFAIKRKLQERLSDEAYAQIGGSTDSEHMFALFRDHYERLTASAAHPASGGRQSPAGPHTPRGPNPNGANHDSNGPSIEVMAEALVTTIDEVVALSRESGTEKPCYLNLAVTDGVRSVVSRYVSGDSDGPSLYVQTGKEFVWESGDCRMVPTDEVRAATLVASEPLTEEPGWTPVPRNHLVLVHPDESVTIRAIE
ncbi:MAG: class II glutamine amidotransferase [Planctomycetales bacterium]